VFPVRLRIRNHPGADADQPRHPLPHPPRHVRGGSRGKDEREHLRRPRAVLRQTALDVTETIPKGLRVAREGEKGSQRGESAGPASEEQTLAKQPDYREAI
jgi:hypothetical protein